MGVVRTGERFMLVLARFVIADKVVQFTLGGTIIMNRDYTTLIARDPQIYGGEPVVRGTLVPVRTILASMAEGGGSTRF